MKDQIKKIAFICHPAKEQLPPLLSQLIEWCEANNIKAYVTKRMGNFINRVDIAIERDQMPDFADIIIVLGGDGSILEAARTFSGKNIAIGGINLGRLGFLTLDEPCNAINTLKKIRDKKFRIEKRTMLKATVIRNNKQVFNGVALNDVVIQKEPMLRVINLKVSISDNPVNKYHGDGLIISTPTGSTAYSLSAGGPIIPPWVKVFILCPLNCHTLSARPVIISNNETIKAELGCVHSRVDIVLDGQESFGLKNNDCVIVNKADDKARIAVLRSRSFFEVLRKKMKWG